MTDEIKVKVNSYGPGRPLGLVWFDPISGKKKAKSARTTDWREAERLAGELEKELLAGRCVSPSKITWADFRSRYDQEKLSTLAERSADQARISLRLVERIVNPDRLAKMTSSVVSAFITKLRKERMKESTIAHHLRHIKAALRWAERHGLLAKAPTFDMPKAGTAKSRPITGEEFDRMLAAVPKVRPNDADAWRRYLRFLWLSGLRLEESLILSWDDDASFAIDLGGKLPAFRIEAQAQKGRRDEVVPIMPDCWELLAKTPEAERTGRAFPLLGGLQAVSHVVLAIGCKAGVVVGRTRRKVWEKINGQRVRVEKEVPQFAGCHTLRRSFGTRWAKRLMPAVLKKLMRHANVATTMTYYVDLDADELGADLWQRFGGQKPIAGNTSGNTCPASEATAASR